MDKVVVQFVQSTMSTLFVSLQANVFKSFWNDRCIIPLVFCQSNKFRSMKQLFNLQILQVYINFSFWWNVASDETASDDVITSGALVFRGFLASFLLIFLLFFCSFRTFVWYKFLSMVLYTWTNNSNSNCQFLIPCYHQNSLRCIFKPILFQQSPPFWWWQTMVFKTWSIVLI